MSKDTTIANIVKELDNLTLEENEQILHFINKSKRNRKRGASKTKELTFRDRDGTPIVTGDRVYLLTRGVNNFIGQEAIIHALPNKLHEFVTFVPIQRDGQPDPSKALHKKSRSVRKKQDDA